MSRVPTCLAVRGWFRLYLNQSLTVNADDNNTGKRWVLYPYSQGCMTCVYLRLSVFLCSYQGQAFISLEKEIEDELPLFQEIIVNLRSVPSSFLNAMSTHTCWGAVSRNDLLPKRLPRGNVCSRRSLSTMLSPSGSASYRVPLAARRTVSKQLSSFGRTISCRSICSHFRYVKRFTSSVYCRCTNSTLNSLCLSLRKPDRPQVPVQDLKKTRSSTQILRLPEYCSHSWNRRRFWRRSSRKQRPTGSLRT